MYEIIPGSAARYNFDTRYRVVT